MLYYTVIVLYFTTTRLLHYHYDYYTKSWVSEHACVSTRQVNRSVSARDTLTVRVILRGAVRVSGSLPTSGRMILWTVMTGC